MDAASIRSAFLDFFATRGHRVVKSSSLVPESDPTLYFVNAGMVQFKDVFTGRETRDYRRACSSQKVLRVSGKHNDLETVGRTPKHHTFFEMLGNFSFGDYFKEEAIAHAWAFLVDDMKLDPERMVVTTFAGEDGIPADEDSYQHWQANVGVPRDRIFKLGKADNFWSMGDTGPCGPCTEVHYLPDKALDPRQVLTEGGPASDARWVEIWNLVFMQYDRGADGTYAPLKHTGVDTGMGLERMAAVLQGVPSTYDTDLLMPLIVRGAELANKKYGADPEADVSLRVIADHARATTFCIADGVFPEKGGREYVLRRIMRRAIRHGKRLGLEEPFFHEVCATVVERMSSAYPELEERRDLILKLVQAEEQAFRRTLGRGLTLLEEGIASAKEAGAAGLEAPFVGKMYDTYGFPIDLTRVIAEEANLAVDEQAAKEWVLTSQESSGSRVGDAAVADIYKQLASTHGQTQFVGYEHERDESKVLAVLIGGEEVEKAQKGAQVELICRETPFYARGGGQVGDTGTIRTPNGTVTIEDTLKPDGSLFVHQGRVSEGSVGRGEQATLTVDTRRRQAIRLNHSATHLLHHALRHVLGSHVAQKGSEVSPNQLRFDFSHFEAMTPEQIYIVERAVNDEIRANVPSSTEVTSYDHARTQGAMALFGEKYGEHVRMVRIGRESVELCGGTHVERAGDIGLFQIVSEEALALGVRRIVAVTGDAAISRTQAQSGLLREAAQVLHTAADQVPERIVRLKEQLKASEQQTKQLKQKLAAGSGSDLLEQVQEVDGIKVLATRVDDCEPKVLREAGDTLRNRIGSGVVILGGVHGGKATLLVMVSKDLTKRIHGGKLVGKLAEIVGGKGGGRPDLGQAGGPLIDRLDDALQQAVSLL